MYYGVDGGQGVDFESGETGDAADKHVGREEAQELLPDVDARRRSLSHTRRTDCSGCGSHTVF